jgi:hypothetical protein
MKNGSRTVGIAATGPLAAPHGGHSNSGYRFEKCSVYLSNCSATSLWSLHWLIILSTFLQNIEVNAQSWLSLKFAELILVQTSKALKMTN